MKLEEKENFVVRNLRISLLRSWYFDVKQLAIDVYRCKLLIVRLSLFQLNLTLNAASAVLSWYFNVIRYDMFKVPVTSCKVVDTHLR